MPAANTQGSHMLALRVTRNNVNTSNCTLKKPFVKKTETWSAFVTDFFLNKAPPILPPVEGPHFRIVPFRPAELRVPVIAERDFTPRPCTTVMDYFAQLQRFFRQYCYIYERATDYHDNLGQAYNLPIPEAFNFIKNDYRVQPDATFADVGTDAFPQESVRVTLDSALRVQLQATPAFLEYFYISVHPKIAEALGFTVDLYSVRVGGVDILD